MVLNLPRLLSRLRTSTFLVVVVVMSVFAGKWSVCLICSYYFLLALGEYFHVCQLRLDPVLRGTLRVLLLGCFVSALASVHALSLWMMCSVLTLLAMFVMHCLQKKQLEFPLADITSSVFALFYLGFCPAHLVLLRSIDYSDIISAELPFTIFRVMVPDMATVQYLFTRISSELGIYTCILVLGTISLNDTFAYLYGKHLGKLKAFPVISPNKTIEGSVAGLIGGGIFFVVVWWLICRHFGYRYDLPVSIAVAFLLGCLGQLGDLFESMLKRFTNTKDSGTYFTEQGGILDRFDSHIFAILAGYYILGAILVRS